MSVVSLSGAALCRGVPAAFLVVASFGSACHDGNSATASAPERSVSAAIPPASSVAARARTSDAAAPLASAGGGDAGARSAGSSTNDAGTQESALGPAPGDASTEPRLADKHGATLPQTDARPTPTSASFLRRIDALARAIASGDPSLAESSFFPLVAYQQVKAIAKPERDYKFRLLANFARDIREYHSRLGAAAGEARFTGIDVPDEQARWMAPGSEGNKIGYFRVLRSRLHFALQKAEVKSFEVTSMISWRGEWYVVHLHGFK